MAVAENLPLEAWQNFYVIVGSSAGALIGLTFIVITIAADTADIAPTAVARLRGLRAFITPTVVHFGVALWVAALLSMPGHSALTLAVGLAGTGALSTVYCANVVRLILEMRGNYQPFLSDWIWSVLLPLCAYMSLLAAAFHVADARTGRCCTSWRCTTLPAASARPAQRLGRHVVLDADRASHSQTGISKGAAVVGPRALSDRSWPGSKPSGGRSRSRVRSRWSAGAATSSAPSASLCSRASTAPDRSRGLRRASRLELQGRSGAHARSG